MNGFSPEENIRFGHRLALARAKAGYSQPDFANAINFNQGEISLYESGRRFPTDETLKILADAVHVDPYWLKYGDFDAVDVKHTEDGTEIHLFHPKNGQSRMKQTALQDLKEENQSIAQSVINALAFYESPAEVQRSIDEEKKQFKEEYRATHVRKIRNDPDKLKKAVKNIARQYFPELSTQIGELNADDDVNRAAQMLRNTIAEALPDLPDEEDDLIYFSKARKILAKKARRSEPI